MTVHAMPVMLGVLAVLAVAYRYYSAFLAAKVAALDDSKTTPAHQQNDGQNFLPTNRWVLFGHHFAAISGAGPLIGPVLAIQFGYLPGLIWLVVGVCLAGAVQDMMVLVASVRRGGESLAAIARQEIGTVAGVATAISILYIIIIALAGLGIVVVKALGGEEVPMKQAAVLIYPEGAPYLKTIRPGAPTIYAIPPGSTYQFGEKEGQAMDFQEPFKLTVPSGTSMRSNPKGPGFVLPEGAKRLVPGSSWVRSPSPARSRSPSSSAGTCTDSARERSWKPHWWERSESWEPPSRGPGSLSPGFGNTSNSAGTRRSVRSLPTVSSRRCFLFGSCSARDYISSFLKIGTIAVLVIGVIVANPVLEAPPINHHFQNGGGPYFDGPIFPYVFICIMCGAISGFHALVSSGTTPKMVDKESHIRMIGYGAMLMEGLVGVVALIAAAALPNSMYYDINIDLARRPQFAQSLKAMNADHDGHPGDTSELVVMEQNVQESLHGRTGGAVTLAVGMARIFSRAVPNMDWLIKYWYHFAIMFEALFILTTIDTGTRIGRFLVQEFLGKLWKPLGNLDWLPASILATALVVFGWAYFIWSGSVETIWPMFGMANQLLAVIALCVVTTALFNAGRGRYAPLTILPMLFVATTTATTGYYEITGKFTKMIKSGAVLKGWLNIGLTAMLLTCVAVILVSAIIKWGSSSKPKPEPASALS